MRIVKHSALTRVADTVAFAVVTQITNLLGHEHANRVSALYDPHVCSACPVAGDSCHEGGSARVDECMYLRHDRKFKLSGGLYRVEQSVTDQFGRCR